MCGVPLRSAFWGTLEGKHMFKAVIISLALAVISYGSASAAIIQALDGDLECTDNGFCSELRIRNFVPYTLTPNTETQVILETFFGPDQHIEFYNNGRSFHSRSNMANDGINYIGDISYTFDLLDENGDFIPELRMSSSANRSVNDVPLDTVLVLERVPLEVFEFVRVYGIRFTLELTSDGVDDFFSQDLINGLNLNSRDRRNRVVTVESIPPVPLPAAVWLFLGALSSFGFYRWRQQKAN